MKSLNFGEAIQALNEGKMVARQGWDNLFVFKQVPSMVDKDIVPKMTSLPDAVKKEFEFRFRKESNYDIASICYSNQLAIVQKSNLIQGYSPSVEDSLANDWFIYEGGKKWH